MFGRLKFFFKRLKSLRVEPEFRRARLWTNIELKKIAHNFTGTVINVSGWADEDKCGAVYRDYFVNAEEYFVSNLGGGAQEGMQKILPDSIPTLVNQLKVNTFKPTIVFFPIRFWSMYLTFSRP